MPSIYCKKCGNQLSDSDKFCYSCGQPTSPPQSQAPQSGNTSMLTILCIMSILGSLFTIGRGMLYELIAEIDGGDYVRGFTYALTSVGTTIGAVMMLGKSLKGLYVYTVCQSIYLLTVIIATSSHMSGKLFRGEEEWAIFIASIFFVPSALFLWVYWSPGVKKCLN